MNRIAQKNSRIVATDDVIELWGADTAANVQKVIWFLHELGLDFRAHGVGYPPELERDAIYLANRDVRSSPVLRIGDFVLWEGNTIVRYIADRYGDERFYSRDLAQRADIERWMDYQLSTIRGPLHALIRDALKPDEVKKRAAALAAAMEPVEETLKRQPYLTGEGFTIGDIPVGITTFRWSVLDVPKPPSPAIDAWLSRLAERPAFAKTVRAPRGANVALLQEPR